MPPRTRVSRPRLGVAAALLALAVVGCTSVFAPAHPPAAPPPAPAHVASLLADVTSQRGIRFAHHQSRHGTVEFLPETLGPGVASIDYDGDGFPDLFFVQGSGDADATDPRGAPPSELYRSDGPRAPMNEVGRLAGADLRSWGQAVLAADLDGDGYPDLLVTAYRQPVRILWNEGDGTFRETAAGTGLPAGDRWWSFAAAIDYDQDGLLDLYLGAYVAFGPKDFSDHPPTVDYGFGPMPVTMVPRPWRPEPKMTLRNLGGRRWADVTDPLRMRDPGGRGLGVLATDLDGDGWPDLFVANDVSPCALFHNVGGTFEEIADKAWVNESRGSMGLATEDTDGDGTLDILCSHWVGDVPALYRGTSPGHRLAYRDDADRAGVGRLPRNLVGWAVGFIDIENRGIDDILIIHGHTNHAFGNTTTLEPQPAILVRAQGKGNYQVRPADPTESEAIDRPLVGRGAALTDLDNDGRLHVAVGVNNGPAQVWECVPAGGHWIGLELIGTRANREALGALIELADGSARRLKTRASGEGFFSTNDRRILFGLGPHCGPCRVSILWGPGRHEEFPGLAADRYHRLVEGQGVKASGDSKAAKGAVK